VLGRGAAHCESRVGRASRGLRATRRLPRVSFHLLGARRPRAWRRARDAV
jgi:hypothetical protein